MSHLYGAREPMIRVRAPGLANVVHWRHRYGVYTACGQRTDTQSLEMTEEPPTCLACIETVTC